MPGGWSVLCNPGPQLAQKQALGWAVGRPRASRPYSTGGAPHRAQRLRDRGKHLSVSVTCWPLTSQRHTQTPCCSPWMQRRISFKPSQARQTTGRRFMEMGGHLRTQIPPRYELRGSTCHCACWFARSRKPGQGSPMLFGGCFFYGPHATREEGAQPCSGHQ